ncbi:MAG: hypothetical protein ACE5IF_01960 [Candidatus Bathyarchaeia archaeon]
MQVTKELTIVTTGVLTVTVTGPTKGYVGALAIFNVTWTPFYPRCDIHVDWGDGTSDDYAASFKPEINPGHTYLSPGPYIVTATVTDSRGAEGSGDTLITIRELLDLTFTADKTTGDIPLLVTFTLDIAGGHAPYDWTLDPGDGSTPYGGTRTLPGSFTQQHTYDNLGSFNAVATVTDSEALMAEARTPLFMARIPRWQKAIVGLLAFAAAVYIMKR